MSLKVKLIAFFLLVGIIPLTAIGVLSYNLAQNNIRDEVYSSLEMYFDMAEEALEAYFDDIRKDANVMTATRDIYQSLNILAETGYNTNSLEWWEKVSIVNDIMLILAEQKNYVLIYMTVPSGKIIYSTDSGFLGAYISGRDYIQSALQGRTTWSELFFSNITNNNIMAVSAPVYSNGRSGNIIGTLNLSVGDQRIARIVHEGLDSLGQTADSYLVRSDFNMLSNMRHGELSSGAVLNELMRSEATEPLVGPIQSGDDDFLDVTYYVNYLGNPVRGKLDGRFDRGLGQ